MVFKNFLGWGYGGVTVGIWSSWARGSVVLYGIVGFGGFFCVGS